MRVWAPRGCAPVVAADPGRAKTNFYGALDLKTGRVVAQQCATLNADASAAYLERLLAAYPDVPLLVLWDRAPWHQGAAIREVLAAHPRLELWQFPVAAPDLNPQEHVWKATRETVSHNHREARLPALAQHFEAHLTGTTFATSFLEHRGFYTVCPRSK